MKTKKNTGWNYRQIRQNSWAATFRKGKKAWMMLVIVCFLFAFTGTADASQSTFIHWLDKLIGADETLLTEQLTFLKEYIVNVPVVKEIPFITAEFALSVLDLLSQSALWVVRIFAMNASYFERNPGEVIANMLLVALISAALRLFIQNVAVIGRNRYVMENRFQKLVPLRRIFAVFHKEYIGNLIRVTFCYHAVLILWAFTIVGGVIRYYQYSMVPYILAENPSVTWRQAKALSSAMTKGHKRQMFCTQLSCGYIWLLKLVPVVGLCVGVPLEAELKAEIYFALRANPEIDHSLLIEPAFSGKPYCAAEREGTAAGMAAAREGAAGKEKTAGKEAPDYVLKDLDLEPVRRRKGFFAYGILDIVFIFFTFCMIGWVWEVALHFVRYHTLVNRGTMYGPWIPIYGVGGTAVILILNRYKEDMGRLFMMAVLLCAVLEYATSFLLEFLFNASYWNYRSMFLNLNGRICLSGLLAFGVGGLFAVYIAAPEISRFVQCHSKKKMNLCAAVLCAAFAVDLICCIIFGFNNGAGVGGSL